MTNPGGMRSKRKGYGFERELVLSFKDAGFSCRRVPLSGAGYEKDDIVLTTGWDEEYRIEAKRRARLPSYLTSALATCDATIFREDRGGTFVLLTLEKFKELCQ